MNKLLVLLVACLVVASGCGGRSGRAHVTMHGRIVAESDSCGLLTDESIENVQVRMLNESDELIATGKTSTDLLRGFAGESSIESLEGIAEPCVVPFTIKDVPKAKFYTLEVASQKGPAWSRTELDKNNFKPTMELGKAVVPKSSRSAFCDQLQRLYSSLMKPEDIRKDHGEAWDGWLATAQEVGFDLQRSRVLAGNTAVDDPQMLDFARALEGMKYDEWSTISALNKAAERVTPLARVLISKYDCDLFWDDLGYSPAK